jgi:predicted metal-dependent phosphoesterase TrpH
VAHPFDRWRSGGWREADLAAVVPLVDAIEVFNARCIFQGDNDRALAFAREQGKPGLVGSDAHSYPEIGMATLKGDFDGTPAGLLKTCANSERITRRSSPLIHLTSTFAKVYNKRRGKSR